MPDRGARMTARAVRKAVGRAVLGLGWLLAGAATIAWFWLVMTEVFGFAEHAHYPIKLIGGAVCLGVLSGYAVLRPARWLAGRIDPDGSHQS